MDSLDLKKRVIEAKKNLPKSGITSLFFHYFEIEANNRNKAKLSNVLQLRIASEPITNKLEELVELLKKRK